MTENAKDELRMPADEFDRMMRGALQASSPPVKQGPKVRKARKKVKASVKRRQK